MQAFKLKLYLDCIWPMTLQSGETAREFMGQNADLWFLDLEARHFLPSHYNKCGPKTHYLEWGLSVIHEYHGLLFVVIVNKESLIFYNL